MKSSDLFVQCLEQEGVEVVFGVPGAEILDLVDSLERSSIRFVPARQDSGAAFMAYAYGRVTGKAGVCIASAGAASTQLANALAGGTFDHSPVVAITGQKNLSRIQREALQALDITATLKPVTKWNAQICSAEMIPALVHKAFKFAQTETLGSCHLDLPEDVAIQEVSGRPFPAASLRRPSPPDRVVDGAAELIDEASKVVILVGHGALRGNASDELKDFVEDVNLPVIATSQGKGILPFDHPNFWYTVDTHTADECLAPLREADVVISVGYEMDELPPDLWNPDGQVKIIHMSASASEINRNYMVSVEIIGDIRDSLRNLKMMVRTARKLLLTSDIKQERLKVLEQYADDDSYPLKPQRVLSELAKVLKPEDLLICDMGTHRYWISQYFPAPGPGSVLLNHSHNATGFALPGAIGALVAQPERRTIALCGDGGFLAGCADLATACAMQLPAVTLVLNDKQMSYVRSLQMKRFQSSVGTQPGTPDFVALAKAFGAEGVLLGEKQSLAECIEKAFETGKPTVIEIPVDASENEKVLQHWPQTV